MTKRKRPGTILPCPYFLVETNSMLSAQNEVQQKLFTDPWHSTLFACFHSHHHALLLVHNKDCSLQKPNILFKFMIPDNFLLKLTTVTRTMPITIYLRLL